MKSVRSLERAASTDGRTNKPRCVNVWIATTIFSRGSRRIPAPNDGSGSAPQKKNVTPWS
jgi:hypothetical protein